MRSQRVLLVAGVDALGRVAELEVDALLQARDPLEDRAADVLGDARVDGGLVDHHVALLERPAHRLATPCTTGVRSGRLFESTGVGTATTKKVRLLERLGIRGHLRAWWP